MKATWVLVSLCLALVVSCRVTSGIGNEVGQNKAMKEEARPSVASGDTTTDYCEDNGWYGDGECDEFCKEEDSDCAVTCAAIPVCQEDWIEVESCPQDVACVESSICGSTIYCMERLRRATVIESRHDTRQKTP